jgi:predicted nucleic-acid-binding protein
VIGLDTNVLIRYLTQDDPDQSAKASRVIDDAESGGLFLSLIVICEMVWVLEDAYHQKRDEISNALDKVLQTGQFAFEEKDLVRQALEDYRNGKGDLSDYLVGRVGLEAGCEHTVTFDHGLKGSRFFRLL